jgi:menaquinone-dependent protoporphyrinogen oxidase
MSRLLVAYSTKHGATAEIAQAIADELRQGGHDTDCLPADNVESVDAYDGAIIGSAVYAKRWRRGARRLLKRHGDALAIRPFWIFSSGPCGENPDPSWSEATGVVKRAQALGVRDHVVFGGRLPLEPRNFIERSMVAKTPPEQRDLRNWEEIRSWAARIGAEVGSRSLSSPVRGRDSTVPRLTPRPGR